MTNQLRSPSSLPSKKEPSNPEDRSSQLFRGGSLEKLCLAGVEYSTLGSQARQCHACRADAVTPRPSGHIRHSAALCTSRNYALKVNELACFVSHCCNTRS